MRNHFHCTALLVGENIFKDCNHVISLFQIEIVSTGVERREDVYPCCPEKYPNLKLHIAFKQNGLFYHDKLQKPDGATKKKPDSSEENN